MEIKDALYNSVAVIHFEIQKFGSSIIIIFISIDFICVNNYQPKLYFNCLKQFNQLNGEHSPKIVSCQFLK